MMLAHIFARNNFQDNLKTAVYLRDFKLLARIIRDLRFSGLLRDLDCLFADLSAHCIFPIFKDHYVHLDILALGNVSDTQSLIGNKATRPA